MLENYFLPIYRRNKIKFLLIYRPLKYLQVLVHSAQI